RYGFSAVESIGDAKPPKKFPALDTTSDLLATLSASSTLNVTGFDYNDILNEAIESAASLPKYPATPADNDVLVMLSAYGAAYKASFEITIDKNGYQIVSFWIKTSDLKGYTAATVTFTDKNDEDTTNSIAIDTTDIKTDIGDTEDIYNGWVQCFFFIENELDEEKTVTVDINFGNTTIKDTSVNSYKAGWLAVANMQILNVDEDTFGYTGSGDHTASLTLTKADEKKTAEFDSVYGSQANDIKTGIANPAHYTGANGGSSHIVNNGSLIPGYDNKNDNAYAGLINKEYFGDYSGDWKTSLLTAFNVSATDADLAWKEVFGSASIQPLIIVNELRSRYLLEKQANADNYKNYYTYDEETNEYVKVGETDEFDENTRYFSEKDILNYGFIGESASISANSYTTVSVRVKVSANAVAYIYLVDSDSATKDVLSFTAPNFTFYYDNEGNVLDEEFDEDWDRTEHKSHVVYTLREDGLYEDKDGKLYANTWNYNKVYKNEQQTYYTADGVQVSFEDVVDGETYYKDANHTTVADHVLVTSNGEATVYECIDGEYYYIVKGVAASKVTPFNKSIARYDYTGLSKDYVAVIDGNKDGNDWITVNFIISAGSEAKNYRLELWSGEREKTETEGNTAGGAVLFDYSYYTVSDSTVVDAYETNIINAYKDLLEENRVLSDKEIASSDENISYYEKLVEEKLGKDAVKNSNYEILKNYQATYYTFSLYDSANYVPFNADVAEDNQTGYNYTAGDYSETLAYLNIVDGNNRIIFTDYSAIDQSFKIDTDDDNPDDTTDKDKDTSVWLLVSSIVLVVALLFAILSIVIRDMVKKSKRTKTTSKNNYNPNQRNRYVRKADKAKNDEPVDAEVVDESEPEANETAEEVEPAENNEQVEETAETETSEPAEEAQTEETSEQVDEPEQTESEPEKPDEN
ncbi:MAG: Ptta/En/Spm family transposase, partial [Clostridia bacterium]|nr:Ptta/En/Spm family transposase [Clostridia bacterium]